LLTQSMTAERIGHRSRSMKERTKQQDVPGWTRVAQGRSDSAADGRRERAGFEDANASGQDRGPTQPGPPPVEVAHDHRLTAEAAPGGLVSRTPLQEPPRRDKAGGSALRAASFRRAQNRSALLPLAWFTVWSNGRRFFRSTISTFSCGQPDLFSGCSGNLGRQGGEKTRPQELCGLTSQSEWTV